MKAAPNKAAPTPWRFEKAGEGMAHVFGANGQFVATVRELDARLMVEGVNERARVEHEVYRREPRWEIDIPALVAGAYRDDTL